MRMGIEAESAFALGVPERNLIGDMMMAGEHDDFD